MLMTQAEADMAENFWNSSCGGFDYIAMRHPADKGIDEMWERERLAARLQVRASIPVNALTTGRESGPPACS